MTRAVAYVRVSTDKQADRGVSLEAQRAKIAAYAELYDVEIVAWEVDAGESAGSLDRPGLQRALEALRGRRADALLVVKLDRLTRSVRDLGELLEGTFGREGGPALLSVGEQVDTRTAAGRMVLNILVSVGQWEREAIGERTAAALRHMRAQGRYTGGAAPYGYAVDGEGALVEFPDEQAAITEARALRAAGASLRDISATLALRGHRARSGRPLAPSAIAAMCSPPMTATRAA